MIQEHDQVVLTDSLPELAPEAGDVGVVVHVYSGGEGYEVEFLTLDGESAGIAALKADQVRCVRKGEIADARVLLAA